MFASMYKYTYMYVCMSVHNHIILIQRQKQKNQNEMKWNTTAFKGGISVVVGVSNIFFANLIKFQAHWQILRDYIYKHTNDNKISGIRGFPNQLNSLRKDNLEKCLNCGTYTDFKIGNDFFLKVLRCFYQFWQFYPEYKNPFEKILICFCLCSLICFCL